MENTHEPIIDPDTWELAQEIDRMHCHPRCRNHHEITLFGGLLVCMDCGFAMRACHESHTRKNGMVREYSSYGCGNYFRNGRSACSTHRIYLRPLTEVVLTDIRAKAEIITLHEEDMIRRLAEKKQTQSDQELACIQKTAKALNKRLAELDKLVAATYEDKVKGAIPEAVCIELLNKYQSERNEKNSQLKELKQQMESAAADRDDIQAWADLIRQYRNLESLDRETVLRLIDHIEIGEKKTVNGQKEQEIRIHYKFVGYIG